jgi:glycosyl transferase family 2
VRIHGVLVVRDAVDVVEVAIRQNLSLGLEQVVVVDNGSTDGTTDMLARLADELPVVWSSDPGPFLQAEAMTAAVHDAARAGADWVLPFDADELWVSARPLVDVLADASEHAALRAPLVNFVQRRDRLESAPEGLLTMTMRPKATIKEAQALVEAGERSFLEYQQPSNLIVRASEQVEIKTGSHSAGNLEGQIGAAEGVECLHAPVRSRATLALRAEHGRRVEELGFSGTKDWQARRWAALDAEGRLYDDWPAVSYEDGCLDVGGRRVPLVVDTRLRDVASRWLSVVPA